MNESLEGRHEISWEVLQERTTTFASTLNEALESLGILEVCKGLEIDHICVRLKDSTDVNSLKTQMSQAGQMISSVNVNGREISIWQLNKPLTLEPWHTSGVELPHPKENHSYTDGWEHVEFVLPTDANTIEGVRDTFFTTFSNLTKEQLIADYSYTENEPHAEGGQLPNPTIGIKVNGIGIKFHAKPVQEIIGFTQ